MRVHTFILTSIVVALALLSSVRSSAQSGCPNLGFEDGTFDNWLGGTGFCCPINIGNTNIVAGRHTITTGAGTDPRTNNAVSEVAPGGGTYSARLGNWQSSGQAERLSYTMVVDANNTLFIYRYAVVLEDPSHTAADQPRFEIRMFDQDNNNIDCGLYNVYASSSIPGFVSITNTFGDDVVYKDWTTVGMDLTPYIGQTVTIQFATGDCALGAHYGYAYIDSYCSPLELVTDFCPGLPSATLEAPPGFASYLWSTGETTQSIEVLNPVTGQTISCTLTSVTGCAATLSSVLTPSVVLAGFDFVGDCMNDVQLTSSSAVVSGPPIVSWSWLFDDGTTSTDPDPFHPFVTPGDHWAQLAVESAAGCVDTMTQFMNLLPSPQVDLSVVSPCEGDPVVLTDTSPIINGVVVRRWDLGDGTQVTGDASVTHVYPMAGTYDVQLYVEDLNTCADSMTVPLVIHPYPTVDLGLDTAFCEGGAVVLNAQNVGSDILWSTGSQDQTIVVNATDLIHVTVTPASGCVVSDSIMVTVNPLPVLQLADTTLCNEVVLEVDAANPGNTYLWSTGATDPLTIIPPVSGNYSVTITTPPGCTLVESFNAIFIPSVSVDLGPDQLHCDGTQTILDAGVLPNLSYLWSTGETYQTITVTQTGTFDVQISNGYCSSSDQIGIVFSTLPVLDLQDTIMCVEQQLLMDAGNPGCTYAWSTGETTQQITVANVSGVYSVEVTNPDGCITIDDADVLFMPSIVLDLGLDSVLCEGDVILLDATNPGATYQWNTGSTDSTLIVLVTNDIRVWVTNGYCYGEDSASFEFLPYPLYALPALIDTCFENQANSVTLEAGEIGVWYEWNTGDTTRSITVREYGTYTLSSTSPPRCTITESVLIREYCPPRVFVPNSFTPDGDLVNDQFLPVGYNIKAEEFLVFDRWGSVVYRSDGNAPGWDGTMSGQMLPIGVYAWRFTFRHLEDADGGLGYPETIIGHVNLLR